MDCRNKTILVLVSIIILLSACNSAKPSVSINSEDIIQNETSGIEAETEDSKAVSESAPTLNNEIFEDLDLNYEQMAEKHGGIIDVGYWEDGVFFLHENTPEMYFYFYTIDESNIYSVKPTDIPIEPDARLYGVHVTAEALFLHMPEEMTLKQLKTIVTIDDYEINEIDSEAAYFNGTHLLSFRYGGSYIDIGCDADGTIKKLSRVILTKINATESLWENVSPVKMVNGKPLYINFIDDVPQYKRWNTRVIEAGNDEYGSELLVYSASTLTDFELFKVYANMYGAIEYYKDEVLLSLDELTPDTVIILTTFLSDVAAVNGISFTDNEGNRHMYAFGDSLRDSSFYLVEEPPIIVDDAKKEWIIKNGGTEEWEAFMTILSGDFSLIEDAEYRKHLETMYDSSIVNGKSEWRYIVTDFSGDGKKELFVQYSPDDGYDSALFYYEDGKVECLYSDTAEGNSYIVPLTDGRSLYVNNHWIEPTKVIEKMDSEYAWITEKKYFSILVNYDYRDREWYDETYSQYEVISGEGEYYFFQDYKDGKAYGDPVNISEEEWRQMEKTLDELLIPDSGWSCYSP